MVNQTELMGGPSWLLAAPSDLLRAPRYMRFAHRPCSGTRRRAQILSYGQQPRRGVAERCVCHPTWNGWHVEPERTGKPASGESPPRPDGTWEYHRSRCNGDLIAGMSLERLLNR